VQNPVGYTCRNFMVPIPRAASWKALDEQLIRDAIARRAQPRCGHRETIGERFERDRAALLSLPALASKPATRPLHASVPSCWFAPASPII